ncbi:YqjD family protein [Chromatiaceae bacterium AAb-1]|nr:YqjD family protein [Chromatiaceae bacterium AAb-1]
MAKTTGSNELHNELKSIADALEEFLQNSADKPKAELDKMKSKAESLIKDARAKLSTAGEKLEEQLTQAGEKVSEKARAVSDCTNHYVHDNPWTSVGIGAAVGVVIGVLLSRR